jgi:hypothetical protein
MDTTRIPTDQLATRFDRFTKQFLLRESTNTADIEILVPEWGDQFATEGTRLRGITYDSKEKAIEVYVEGGDHRVVQPKEVWIEEEADGFIKAIEIVPGDSPNLMKSPAASKARRRQSTRGESPIPIERSREQLPGQTE